MQVQRSWMYLENIFIGSEDIRKQLPKESVLFDQVHTTFMAQMQQLSSMRNVVQVCFTTITLCSSLSSTA